MLKVYGKSKDVFGWPEESEELLNGNIPAPTPSATVPVPGIEPEGTSAVPVPISSLDRFYCTCRHIRICPTLRLVCHEITSQLSIVAMATTDTKSKTGSFFNCCHFCLLACSPCIMLSHSNNNVAMSKWYHVAMG